MDHYAADAAAVVEHLDLTERRPYRPFDRRRRGGALCRAPRQPQGRVAKAVLVGAVPPIMVKTASQSRRPADRGVRRLAQGARRQSRAVLLDVPSGPFYGFNRPGAKVIQGVIQNWWRQGMMGGARRTTTASRPSRRPTSPRT